MLLSKYIYGYLKHRSGIIGRVVRERNAGDIKQVARKHEAVHTYTNCLLCDRGALLSPNPIETSSIRHRQSSGAFLVYFEGVSFFIFVLTSR